MDLQLVRLYKLVLNEQGKAVSIKHIKPGRMDIEVEYPMGGGSVTSTCTVGTNDVVCVCGTVNCDFNNDYDWDEGDYYWWEEEEARWDKLLGKRPTENWDE